MATISRGGKTIKRALGAEARTEELNSTGTSSTASTVFDKPRATVRPLKVLL